MSKMAYAIAASTLLLAGCQAISDILPTQATKAKPAAPTQGTSSGTVTISIPTVVGVLPVPTPAPTASPTKPNNPAPTPTPAPVTQGKCGQPVPGEVSRVNTKIHIRGANRYILDSTPLVGPDAGYCKEIGFTDGRLWCPVRPEGHPEREACEEIAVGYAKDTKRPGPTWTINGAPCNGTDCENHEDNQYLLYAYKGGKYEACVKNGVCGQVDVDR
jgi:hypothetical protein